MTGLSNPGNIFNVNDWYWFVAGNKSKVYSSRIGDYVLSSDPTYVAWTKTGSITAPVDSEASLGQTLAFYIDSLTTRTSTSLPIQQAIKQAELDKLLITNADVVTMVKGGQNSSTTGTGIANFLSTSTNNYRSLRTQIANATSAAQVQGININAGWPANN